MAVTMEQIKELRTRTGAGVVDAKQALEESEANVEKAITWLREKGKATAAKKASRATNEGYIASYVHGNGKLAVLAALTCETDFVSRNEKFQELARNIAMHAAAMDPVSVRAEDIPQEEVEAERQLAQKQVEASGKPPEIQAKIIEGKLKKFREERALLTQPYVKDPKKTVQDIIQEAVHELGENISVKEVRRVAI